MELSPSLMVLDPDVNDPERGTTVGHEKKVGATNHVVEIVTMTITGKEAVRERGTVIVTEIVTENETERGNIVTVKGRYHREADRVRERRAVFWEEEGGGWPHSPVDGVREAVPERGHVCICEKNSIQVA